ncbi:Hypothetical protein I5071_78760 [Sandaracinus amylolyticus]|nr:Hypothetical protein I5071_78760 [Sandaracinus amylolyticus]
MANAGLETCEESCPAPMAAPAYSCAIADAVCSRTE